MNVVAAESVGKTPLIEISFWRNGEKCKDVLRKLSMSYMYANARTVDILMSGLFKSTTFLGTVRPTVSL